MNNFFKIIFVLAIIFQFPVVATAFFDNTAKITIKVVSENGEAIEGARVGIGFENYRSQNKEIPVVGMTDKRGMFTGEASSTSGFLGYNVRTPGFYLSKGQFEFQDKNVFRWLPWNPTIEVLLRKIENPIPMYARDTTESRVEIPEIDKDIGFDLIKFDWVTPYGNGTNSDFIFHLKRRVADRRDFDSTLTVTFSNKYDGIRSHREELKDGSLFKLPRYAPETGYETKLVLREWRDQGEATVHRNIDFNAKDLNYIFRVRSKEEKGVVTEAMYGKIIGGLRFGAVFSKTAKIFFKYYLNPDNTRNLEFDPNRNLFGTLPSLEQVGIK